MGVNKYKSKRVWRGVGYSMWKRKTDGEVKLGKGWVIACLVSPMLVIPQLSLKSSLFRPPIIIMIQQREQDSSRVRTSVRRLNSSTLQIHSVGQIISQSYILKPIDLTQGFRDNSILVQQVNDGLHIEVFYPKDIMDLKNEIKLLKQGIESAQNGGSGDNGYETVENVEVVFYDVETQTKSFPDFPRKGQAPSIGLGTCSEDVSRTRLEELQQQHLVREKELNEKVERLTEEVKSLRKGDANTQMKKLRKELEESKLLIIQLEETTLKWQTESSSKDSQLCVSLKLIESMKVENQLQRQKLRKEKRAVTLQNQELSNNNNRLLEDVINLQAKLLTLMQQLENHTHKQKVVVIEEIREEKWIEDEEAVHRENQQLRADVNSHISRNRALAKEVEGLQVREKEQGRVIKELRKKNKGLKGSLKEKEIEVEEIEIVEYDVEIQTQITALNFPTFPPATSSTLSVGQRTEHPQSRPRYLSSDITGTQQILSDKQYTKAINKLKDEVNKSNSKNRSILKEIQTLDARIKEYKKTITQLRAKNKQLQSRESGSRISDQEEIVVQYLVEYDVEIQTQITSLRPENGNLFTLLDTQISESSSVSLVVTNITNPTKQTIQYVEVPVIVKEQVIVYKQVAGPQRVVEIIVEKIVQKPGVETVREIMVPTTVQKIVEVVKYVDKPIEIIVEKPVEVIVEKVIERIVQKPVYVDKIEGKQAGRQVKEAPIHSSEHKELVTIKEQHIKLKDLFDKVYADNLVLIQLHEQSKSYSSTIKQNQNLLAKHQQTIRTLQSTNKDLMNINQNLQNKVKILDNNIQSYQSTIRTLNNNHKTLQNNIKILQVQNSNYSLNAANNTKTHDAIVQKHTIQIQNIKRINTQFQSTIQSLTQQRNNLQMKYQTDINSHKDLNELIKRDVIVMEQEIRRMEKEGQKGRNRILELENEIMHLKGEREGVVKENNNLQELIKTLRVEIEKINSNGEGSKKQQQTPTRNESGQKNNSPITKMNLSAQRLKSEIVNKDTEIQLLKTKLSSRDKNISALNDHLKSFQEASTQVAKQILTLTQTIEQLKSTITQKDSQLNKLKTEKDKLYQDASTFKKQQGEMRLEIQQLNQMRIELERISKERAEMEGMSSDEKYNKLSQEYRKASEKVYELTLLLDQQRAVASKLKSENQVASISLSRLSHESKGKTIVTEGELVSHQEYLRVVNDLKASQDVILNLKGIISEYQQLIDQHNEGKDENEQDKSGGSERVYEAILKEKIEEYEDLIRTKIDYIDDLALKTQERGLITESDPNGIIDKLMKKLRKERSKRQSLEGRLMKLGESLIDYEKQIIQKTEKISYLNYQLLNIKEKSEVSRVIEDQSLSDIERDERSYESSHRDYRDYKEPYPHFGQDYRYKKYLIRGKYPYQKSKIFSEREFMRGHRQSVLSGEFDIQYQRKQLQDHHQGYFDKVIGDMDKEQLNEECVSLRTLVDDPEDLNPMILTAVFMKVIEEVEANVEKTLHLTPDNIFISQFDGDNPQNIRIRLGQSSTRRPSNSLYQSPELILHNDYSEASVIWTLGVIFDELIHKSLFFPKMSAIADSTFHYRFRLNSTQLYGLKKIILKMVLKDKSQRINIPNLTVSFELEFDKVCSKEQ